MFRPLTILFACAFAVSFAHADDATPAATADAAAPAAVEAAAPAADVAPAAEEVAPAVEAETEDVAAADNAGDLPVPDGVTHNVRLSRSVDGYLQVTAQELYNYATLAAPEQGTVKLGLKGQKVAEAQVGPGGVFQIPGLQDGRYSFVVNTPYGFGTFAHYVSGPLAGQRAGSGVVAGLVPPADYGFVRGLIMDNPSSGVDADGGAVLPAEVL
ncbi:MAG: hypothetical protein KDA90_23140, partial [Planctomycetaceae bacterium]|nr:hypothetical protein [Planctomycetaceae bacterium]